MATYARVASNLLLMSSSSAMIFSSLSSLFFSLSSLFLSLSSSCFFRFFFDFRGEPLT